MAAVLHGYMGDKSTIVEHQLVLSALDMLVSRLVEAERKPLVPSLPAPSIELGLSLDELEARYIVATIDSLDGNKTLAAKSLGIDRRTVYRILARANRGQGR